VVKRIADGRCSACAHFVDDPADFECAFPGILILSSGQGESRGNQGLCQVHERLLTPTASCERFVTRKTR